MIKAIIFDWSKVLTKEGMSSSICRSLSKKLKMPYKKAKESFKRTEDPYCRGKISWKVFLQRFLKDLNIKTDVNKLKSSLSHIPRLNKELFNLIKNLKKDYKIILFSDNHKEMVQAIKKRYNLKKYFNQIIFSYETGSRKPETKIYNILIKKTKINSKQAIFIDDREVNIKKAKEFGMKTILFKNNKQLKKDLKSFLIKNK